MTKFNTINNSSHKEEQIKVLQHTLADLIAMKLQLKHAHWNVRGLHFYQVHLLFDEIANEIEGYIDMVAEKITILGGVAKGLAHHVKEHTTLPQYPEHAVKDVDHLKALIESLGNLTNKMRDDIKYLGEDLECPTTEDLYVEIVRVLDKKVWFLEAHVNH